MLFHVDLCVGRRGCWQSCIWRLRMLSRKAREAEKFLPSLCLDFHCCLCWGRAVCVPWLLETLKSTCHTLHGCSSATLTSLREWESITFKPPSPLTKVLQEFLITCRLSLNSLVYEKDASGFYQSLSMIQWYQVFYIFCLISPGVLVSSGKTTYTSLGNGSTQLMWLLGDCPSHCVAKRHIWSKQGLDSRGVHMGLSHQTSTQFLWNRIFPLLAWQPLEFRLVSTNCIFHHMKWSYLFANKTKIMRKEPRQREGGEIDRW